MARTRIARFNIQITASAEQIRQVFSKAGEQARKFGADLQENIGKAANAFNEITDAVGRLAQPLIDAGQRIIELGNVSNRLRVDPGILQGWQLAAQLVGETGDRMNDALTELQEKLGEVASGVAGGDILEGLQLIGLETTDLQGNFTQMAQTVFRALTDVEDQTIKAAAAAKLLGGSGVELIGAFDPAIWDKVNDQLERTGTITEEQIESVRQLEQQWTQLVATIQAGITNFVAKNAPAYQRAIQGILDDPVFGRTQAAQGQGVIERINRAVVGAYADLSRRTGVGLEGFAGVVGRAGIPTELLERRAFELQTFAGELTDSIEEAFKPTNQILQAIEEKTPEGTLAIVEGGVQ